MDKLSKKTWYMRNLSYHNLSPEEWWCQWCQWCPLTFKFTMVPHGVPMVSAWCPIENPGASPRYEASVEKNSSKRPALRPACEAREFRSRSWSIIQITSLRHKYIYICVWVDICINLIYNIHIYIHTSATQKWSTIPFHWVHDPSFGLGREPWGLPASAFQHGLLRISGGAKERWKISKWAMGISQWIISFHKFSLVV